MTNNEIVEVVYRTYKIKSLVNTMIDYSIKDKSNDDLCQYIYEYLLTYDNIRLNKMYNDKKLRPFISQIIRNSRNGGNNGRNTVYQNQLRIKSGNDMYLEQMEIPDTSEYDFGIDLILEYVDSKAEMIEGKNYSSDELKSILAFTLLKKYFMSELTQIALAKHLCMSRITIGKLLKIAKLDVLAWWETTGQYIEIKITI